MRIAKLSLFCLAGLTGFTASTVLAEDIAGSKDHPLVGRYEGSSISFYKASEFDEAALLRAPHNYVGLLERGAVQDRSGPEWLKAEGRATKIRYDIPEGRSSLEVLRNYEASLSGRGFQTVYKCANQDCFEGGISDAHLLGQQIDVTNGVSTAYAENVRYMLVKFDRPEGAVYGSLIAGEDQGNVVAFVTVVETKPLETGKIAFVDASEIQSAITQAGSVSLYGVQFDYDKDVLRPESKPTLEEIAKLLNGKAALRLEIVGHTDSRGGEDYNLGLSQRRAANVVAALVHDHAIAAERLTSSGAGMKAPVATNDTEEGRAKNRRVELVAK